MNRTSSSPRKHLELLTVALLTVCVIPTDAIQALTIDGAVADKNLFLGYLINQGGGGNPNSFAFLNNNGVNGPSVLISDPNLAANHFGSRMAHAAMLDVNNNESFPLTVHVGQNVPRVFFGAFQFDPSAMNAVINHQTIDLADILKLPSRSNNNLIGGTDIILHEVFEGISALGGGAFAPAHFGSGYQEENSNRSADNNKGVRAIDPMRPDQFTFIDQSTGAYRFRTAWDIIAGGIVEKSGWLIINGRLAGGNNYTVDDIQRGYTGIGGDSLNLFDVGVDSVRFAVPEPTCGIPLIVGILCTIANLRNRSCLLR